jgi:FkbM family methyltransferase
MRGLRRRLHLHLVRPVWRSSRRLAPTPGRFLSLWAVVVRGFAELYVPALRSDRRRTIVVQGAAGERQITLRGNAWDTFTFYEVLLKEVYRGALPLRDGATVLDLGANIGLTSAYLQLHEPTVRIVAVEPEPENFALLEQNLTGTGARVHRAAISDGGGEAILALREATRHRIDPDGSPGVDRIAVPVLTLDDLLDPRQRADVMKVDIEGSEAAVFARGRRALDSVDKVLVEIHDPAAAHVVSRTLTAAGFRHVARPPDAVELPELYVR